VTQFGNLAPRAEECFVLAHPTPTGLQLLGTGFAIGGRRIATALHVIGVANDPVVLIVPRLTVNGYQDLTVQQVQSRPLALIAADPLRDLAVLELPDGDFATATHPITGTDGTQPGDPVLMLGYPHAPTGRMVLTDQRGEVGARVLMATQGVASKYLVLNTLLRPGQSGGPVFNLRTNELVAVLVGAWVPEGAAGAIMLGDVDPAALHQTTHAISAEYLARMSA
jgi:S1-C subfamily serine protease